MQATQLAGLQHTHCFRRAIEHRFPHTQLQWATRVSCIHSAAPAQVAGKQRAVQVFPPAVDWRQAVAARQAGAREDAQAGASEERNAGCTVSIEEGERSEQETHALYRGWVRHGSHRDAVWQDGVVKLGEQLVRIRNGQVSIVAPPSKKIVALAAAAAPATRSCVAERVKRRQAGLAQLRALVERRARDYKRSAARAAYRDARDQTSTASHLHLLLACYDRLTLPQEKKYSRRVLEYHALHQVRDELEVRLQRSARDGEWAQAADLGSVEELRRRVEQGVSAKCRLVEGNIRLAVSIAKNYQGMGLDFEDLVQAGIVGLIKGVDRYDVRKGFRFSTYATFWIRQSIQLTVRRDGRLIRLPAYAWDRLSKIAKARSHLSLRLGRAATLAETAAAVKLSEDQVRTLLAASAEVLSLEQGGAALLRRNLATGESVAAWREKLQDPDCDKDPYETLAEHGAPADIERILSRLEEQEALVLALRLGLRGQAVHTLGQTSKQASVAFAKVAVIQDKAIEKLRGPYKKDVEDLLTV